MNFYDLSVGYSNNTEWRAILEGEVNRKHQIVSTLNEGNALKLNNHFDMRLINVHLPEDRKEKKPFELDLLYWTNDLMLDAFSPRKSTCVIVSRKLKELISKYYFHEHDFYPIHLYDIDRSSYKEYYLLQIFGKRMDYIDYQKSDYVLKERPSRKIVEQISESSKFENLSSFIDKRSKYLREKNLLLDFSREVYTVNYDVLWGTPNKLRINGKIKEDIENSGIKGVELTLIKSPQYILKSEFEGLI